jgi:hypothetical protein
MGCSFKIVLDPGDEQFNTCDKTTVIRGEERDGSFMRVSGNFGAKLLDTPITQLHFFQFPLVLSGYNRGSDLSYPEKILYIAYYTIKIIN